MIFYWNIPTGTDATNSDYDKVDTTTFAWTPNIRVGKLRSLLTIGNKAGYVTLWHIFDAKNIHVAFAKKVVENGWITYLSWSSWFIVNGERYAYLACCSSSGSIKILKFKFSGSYQDDILNNI